MEINDWKRCDEMPPAETMVLGYNPRWEQRIWPCFVSAGRWANWEGIFFTEDDAPLAWREMPATPNDPKLSDGGGLARPLPRQNNQNAPNERTA